MLVTLKGNEQDKSNTNHIEYMNNLLCMQFKCAVLRNHFKHDNLSDLIDLQLWISGRDHASNNKANYRYNYLTHLHLSFADDDKTMYYIKSYGHSIFV